MSASSSIAGVIDAARAAPALDAALVERVTTMAGNLAVNLVVAALIFGLTLFVANWAGKAMERMLSRTRGTREAAVAAARGNKKAASWAASDQAGGAGRSRTALDGFAIRCITILLLGPKRHASRKLHDAYKLERETRLELATPTLARSCSTN